MRAFKWKQKDFTNIFEMLDFVNTNDLNTDDFKVFSHQGYIILIYNEGALIK